jgi:hypothetical protein
MQKAELTLGLVILRQPGYLTEKEKDPLLSARAFQQVWRFVDYSRQPYQTITTNQVIITGYFKLRVMF